MEVPLIEVELADPGIRPNEAKGVIHRLSDPDPFFTSGGALGEHSQLSQGPAQVSTGEHGGKAGHPEALTEQVPFERRDVPAEVVDCATIVTQGRED